MNNPKRRLLIALSAGGTNSELAAHGIGVEHVEELMVRMAMRLLADGHRLSFGGTLGNPDQELTKHLIDTAERWLDDDAAKKVDVTKPETWPLVNYSAWPHYKNITEEQRARMVGICQFINIDPPGVPESILKADLEPGVKSKHSANALTAMRERSAQEADLRIVWGGRIKGAAGWMAGILEEVACTLKLKKPLLILGGFGGCARLLADFLNDPKAEWPAPLSLAASADPTRDALLTDEEHKELEARMLEVKQLAMEFWKVLHSTDAVHGLPATFIRKALLDENSRSVINAAADFTQQLKTIPESMNSEYHDVT